jgi:hypothetical protein
MRKYQNGHKMTSQRRQMHKRVLKRIKQRHRLFQYFRTLSDESEQKP